MTGDAASERSAAPFSAARIGAMVVRYVYILRGSWPRIIELAYWPLMQVVLWGFISKFLATNSSWVAQGAGVLIGAVLLWDILFRGQLGFSVSFLEEMWSRNLANLFVSPLRPYEFVLALIIMSLIRTLIGVVPAALLAILFYRYSVFDLGLPLIAFFFLLMMLGWAVGLIITAIILRFGLGAESLAWIAMFAIAPLSGVFYPVATLPEWLQTVSWALPSAYVFEGMRAIIFDGTVRLDHLATALALNVAYITAAGAFFLHTFHIARREGLLMTLGE
ncbi:MAG TPA: ABC transporter permease [Alphaproteobacteria bacterium]|nr:ABC transporter permease [Alphaproteobacteria bacterium]